MTFTARLLSGASLALLLVTAPAVAFDAQSLFSLRAPSPTGAYLAGRQAMKDLRMDDAAAYFREAASSDWENPLVIERAFIAYAADGQVADAATMAKHLIELSGANDLAALVIGTESLKQRRYGAAERELADVGADTFAGITGGMLRAWALIGDGRVDEADAIVEELGQGGLDGFLVFHRAVMADVAGRSSEALRLIRVAYDADPFVTRIVEAYARMLGNAGRFNEAEEVIAKYEAQGLSHPLIDAVKEAVDAKRRPGAFAINVQSGAAEMFHSVGVALAREGSRDIAALFLRMGMYLDPKADVIDLVYAQLLDAVDQHELANEVYEGIPSTSPLKPTAVVQFAENLDAMGDRAEALRRLGNIVVTNPEDVDALSVLGDLQRTDKQYDAAAETYTKAIDAVGGEAPGHWRYYYVRGIAYERAKQWDKAEADFKKALELNPDQPQVLNYLGYSWVDQGVNLIPALDMIERAVAASPNDGYIIDSLGWAYYRLGRYEEAVATLEAAVQLQSTDPEINDHLGDAYWRAGRELEARFQWNIAASVDEDGNVKKRVADKLLNGLEPLPAPEPGPVAETESLTKTK